MQVFKRGMTVSVFLSTMIFRHHCTKRQPIWATLLGSKMAFKWIAHMNQMEQIKNDSPDRVLIVHFDDLVQRQAQTLNENVISIFGLVSH